jgi:endoglycosylceramidase
MKRSPGTLYLFLLSLAVLLGPPIQGCGGDGGGNDRNSGQGSGQRPDVKTLGWIHQQDGRLTDEYGREWVARGVNARVKKLFDGNEYWQQHLPAYGKEDAEGMARDGFNLLRLPINWSGLEPNEGEFDEAYLAQVEQVVSWAAEAGLYVLIDFHQDKYSRYAGGDDGAPWWAVWPPIAPELNAPPLSPEEIPGIPPQVILATAAFFLDVENLQERFLPAWQFVVSRFAGRPGVVGFEPYNEPSIFVMSLLYQFYERCAGALREIDERHTLWLEPDSYRNNLLLWAPLRQESFPDGNVVYEPHHYPNFAGMNYETVGEWVEKLTWTFDHLVEEARSWGAPAVIGEWGTNPNDSFAPAMFQAIQQLSDVRDIGLAFWVWKECTSGGWGLFDCDPETDTWTERTGPGVDALLRPGVMAVPGRLVSQSFDQETKRLRILFEAQGGEGPPLLYVPERYYPGGAAIELDGRGVDYHLDPATQRVLLPWQGMAGTHEILLRPRP